MTIMTIAITIIWPSSLFLCVNNNNIHNNNNNNNNSDHNNNINNNIVHAFLEGVGEATQNQQRFKLREDVKLWLKNSVYVRRPAFSRVVCVLLNCSEARETQRLKTSIFAICKRPPINLKPLAALRHEPHKQVTSQ